MRMVEWPFLFGVKGEKAMPYKMKKVRGGGYRVTSPHGVKAKNTSRAKAQAQINLLRGVEKGWRPSGEKPKKKHGGPAHGGYPHHSPAKPV